MIFEKFFKFHFIESWRLTICHHGSDSYLQKCIQKGKLIIIGRICFLSLSLDKNKCIKYKIKI